MPLAAIGAIAAVGGIASSAIGANAAGNAADAQVNAANNAAQLQASQANNALDFQKNQFNTGQQELAPFLTGGQGAEVNLSYLMGTAPPSAFTGNAGVPGPLQNIPSIGPNGKPISDGSYVRDPTTGGIYRIAGGQAKPLTPSQWDAASKGGASYQSFPGFSADVGKATATGQAAAGQAGSGPPLSSLVNTNLGAFGSLSQPFQGTFQAPTALTEQNDPGFQERLNLGQQALERSAAAKGNLLTGGLAQGENQFAQDYASNEYGNVYNRAFNQYAQNYNQFQTGQANLYNRLAGQAGLGQQTAGQLGYLGQNAAGNATNILLGSGQQIGNDIQNAGAARASGYVGGANAIGGGINSLTNSLGGYLSLASLLNQNGGGNPPNPMLGNDTFNI